MPLPSFSDLFSVENFARLFEAPDEPQEAFSGIADEAFRPAVMKLLVALRDADKLQPIAGSRGRRGNFMHSWDNFISGAPDEDGRHLRDVARLVSRSFFSDILMGRWDVKEGKRTKEEAVAAGYSKLTEALDRGEMLKPWGASEEYDFVSGERFRVLFDGWAVRMVSGEDLKTPMQDLEEPKVEHLEVTFESGEVLIADWFRINAFTKATDTAFRNDINSVSGRVAETKEQLEQHGFVTVFANGSPHVLKRDGALVFGSIDEDDENAETPLGRVWCELRWVTIIDRKRLEEIVVEAMGSEEAGMAAVAAYIANPIHGVITVNLEPGTHQLYFSGEPWNFGERFSSPDLDLACDEPQFVLSPRRLELANDRAAPSGPR